MWKSAAISARRRLAASSAFGSPRALTAPETQSYSGRHFLSTSPQHNNNVFDVAFASDLVRPHAEFVHEKTDGRGDIDKTSSTPPEFSFGTISESPRTSVLMELTDRVGVLHDVLKYFWKHDVNITRIESRPHKMDPVTKETVFDFYLDL